MGLIGTEAIRGRSPAAAWLLATSLAVGGLVAPVTLQARTWYVERDGSGDFAVIQDAVDAAASGDTIRIGRGRFNEGQMVDLAGGAQYIRVLVRPQELTIIGSKEDTIIGLEESWDLSQGMHMGILALPIFGSERIVVEDIKFENMGYGINVQDNTVKIIRCMFENNHYSLVSFDGLSLTVDDCRFSHLARDGRHITGINQSQAIVRDCEFVLAYEHQWPQIAVSFTNVASSTIENCSFVGGVGAVHVGLAGHHTVSNCTFFNQQISSVSVGYYASLTIADCVFQHIRMALRAWDHGTLDAQRCVVESPYDGSVWVDLSTTVSVRDSDLASGSRGAVWVENCWTSPPPTLDFTNNYWGTDDADDIAVLIHDRNDDEAVCAYVNFVPYRSHSVPIEQKTWSEVKGLFRE
ncbi:MAG: right-handed parallel beta-helix repeat-containing protein [Candidatus Krumholzibacteria bacterium]|nr:right-handed parallel beta-helix repeat-containing protein [Candidatus Krumholzibacteria bacterium]